MTSSGPPTPPSADRPDDPLVGEVYANLRRLARGQLGRLPPGQTLQATALVHEAWLKLAQQPQPVPRDRFTAAAAVAMRDILVDRARARLAHKRGGGRQHVDVHDAEPEVTPALPVPDVLTLDGALQQLQAADATAAELVMRRFFLGETMAEIAMHQGCDERTVYRLWRFARAFLVARLGDDFLPEAR